MTTWRKKRGIPVAADPANRSNPDDFLAAMMQFGVFAPVLLQSWNPQRKRGRGRRTS